MTVTTPYTVRPLDASTWDAFAELMERNNGVFGGCWCIGFHAEGGQCGLNRRAIKADRVRTGTTHSAVLLRGHETPGEGRRPRRGRRSARPDVRQVGKHAWIVSRRIDPV